MRSRPSRALAGALVAALLLVPGAQAGVAFKGFSTKRANALRGDLGKSLFPYPAFVDVVVKPGELPEGSLGHVNLIACALVIPTSVLLAPIGVRLAHGLSRKTLERAFGVFMLAVAARFAWSLVA